MPAATTGDNAKKARDRPVTALAGRLLTTAEAHRRRLARREQWINFIAYFVPAEGYSVVADEHGPPVEAAVDPGVRDAVRRAVMAACDTIEAEAERDTKLARRGRPADVPAIPSS